MSSSLRTRFTIDVAGQPYQFSQPFVQSYLVLEQDPMQYVVQVPANDSAVLWAGSPAFDTLDFLALMSDRDVTLSFAVNGGSAADFQLFLLGGGFPVVLNGLPTGSEITNVTAANADVDNAAFVSVCVAQVEQ